LIACAIWIISMDNIVPAMLCITHMYNILTSEIATLFCQDRIIARLQQPYSLDCIPVEAEYQVVFFLFMFLTFFFFYGINKNFDLLRTHVVL
jgi:hypothetical protein